MLANLTNLKFSPLYVMLSICENKQRNISGARHGVFLYYIAVAFLFIHFEERKKKSAVGMINHSEQACQQLT